LPHSTSDRSRDDARTTAKYGFDGIGFAKYGTPIVLINGNGETLNFVSQDAARAFMEKRLCIKKKTISSGKKP
jgi:hypothetical protein